MKGLLNNFVVVMAFLVLWIMDFDFVIIGNMVELIANKMR